MLLSNTELTVLEGLIPSFGASRTPCSPSPREQGGFPIPSAPLSGQGAGPRGSTGRAPRQSAASAQLSLCPLSPQPSWPREPPRTPPCPLGTRHPGSDPACVWGSCLSLRAHRDSARGCVWRRVSAAKHPGAGHRAGSCGDRAGARARAPGMEGQVPRCGAVRGAAVRGDPRRGWRHVSISHGRVNGSAHTSQRRQGQLRTEGVRSDTSANGPGIPRLLPPARSGARLGELGTSRWAQRHRPAPPARIKPGFPPDPARRTVPCRGQTQHRTPAPSAESPCVPSGQEGGPGVPRRA